MSLFRDEAVKSQHREYLGSIQLVGPVNNWIWVAAAFSLCTMLCTFLVFGHYTEHATVSGTLVPRSGLITATASAQGTLSRLFVTEGQRVVTGDALVAISGEEESADLGSTKSAVSDFLNQQIVTVNQDIEHRRQLSKAEVAGLHERLSLLRGEVGKLDAQIQLERQDVGILNGALLRSHALQQQGFISLNDFEKQQSAALEQESTLDGLMRQRLDAQASISTAEQQLAQAPLTEASDINDLTRRLKEAQQSLAQNEVSRELVIHAPCDGTVSATLVRTGQSVTVGESLLSIAPVGAPLEAHLLVPSRAAGFIRSGNSVLLRYEAFPYAKFGAQPGRVGGVSHNTLTQAEITALRGPQVQESMYMAVVLLDQQFVSAYGRNEPLQAGMALDAEILLDSRRLIEWIMEPLYQLRGGA
jgi:membrane fusion protein